MNVNRLGRDGLDRLLQELGVEKTERDMIVDSIQDWRDANDEHRLNGAESDYYLGLSPPYRSKNADFDSVDGAPPGAAASLGPFSRPWRNLRPRGVPHCVRDGRDQREHGQPVSAARRPGPRSAEVDMLIEAGRPYADLTALPPGLRRGNQRTTSDTFRIEAWAGVPVPAGRVLSGRRSGARP